MFFVVGITRGVRFCPKFLGEDPKIADVFSGAKSIAE